MKNKHFLIIMSTQKHTKDVSYISYYLEIRSLLRLYASLNHTDANWPHRVADKTYRGRVHTEMRIQSPDGLLNLPSPSWAYCHWRTDKSELSTHCSMPNCHLLEDLTGLLRQTLHDAKTSSKRCSTSSRYKKTSYTIRIHTRVDQHHVVAMKSTTHVCIGKCPTRTD